MTSVLFSVDAGVLTITLNRPEKLNALNPAMLEQLARALERAKHEREIRAVLLTGAGRGFCTRQDLGARHGTGMARREPERRAGGRMGADLESGRRCEPRRRSPAARGKPCAGADEGLRLAETSDVRVRLEFPRCATRSRARPATRGRP